MSERYYTVSEVALKLSVSRSTVYRLMKDGSLAYHKMPGKHRGRRVTQAQVEGMMQALEAAQREQEQAEEESALCRRAGPRLYNSEAV